MRVHSPVVLAVVLLLAPSGAPVVAGETGAASKPPSYFVVPLHGVVGREITAEVLGRAFKIGLKEDDTVLVLDIESDGGLVSECEKILEVMKGQRDRRTVAYVRRALSAAAIISLTCDEIYMHRDATIGAATAIRSSEGRVTEVDEKFKSVWRTTCRRAAEIGGHDTLFAEAMVDPGVGVALVETGGKTELERFSARRLRRGKIIVDRGKLLTATAREAESYGLASGVVKSFEEVLETAPGLEGGKATSTRGESLLEAFAARFKSTEKKVESEFARAKKEFERAIEFSPVRQNYTVQSSGRFTPGSLRKWRSYSKKCYGHLRRCDESLGKIIRYSEDFPVLGLLAELAEGMREEVKELREEVAVLARRRGV